MLLHLILERLSQPIDFSDLVEVTKQSTSSANCNCWGAADVGVQVLICMLHFEMLRLSGLYLGYPFRDSVYLFH
ncbi:hypothetical protein DITRI_Ditri11bG0011600 [Diplodiscus trichospermus]